MAITNFWKCDDNAASLTVVATTGTNAVTESGWLSALIHSTSAPAGGVITASLDLGANTGINISGSSLSITSGVAFSFGTFIEFDAGTGFILGDPGGSKWYVYKASDTTIEVRGTSTSRTYTVPSLGTTNWRHILVTKSTADAVRVFVDGVESVTGAQTIAQTSTIGYVGQAGGSAIDAKFAWIKTWNSDESANAAAIAGEAAPGNAIAITESNATVTPWKVLQRNGSNQADITISGTVTANKSVEASFNGGAYVTIDSTTSGGTFSGTLSAQAAGRGTITVRITDDTGITDTVANFGIGDVFVVGGDSISEGRGDNPQSYSGAAKCSVFRQDDAWAEGNDPIDTNTTSGSHWPLLATAFMADQTSIPIAFISCGTGATDVAGSANSWAKNNTEYAGMISQVSDSGVNSVKAVLMHLGPNAVVNASTLSQATYNAALDTLASNFAADIAGAPKLVLGVFGETGTGSPPDRTAALNNLRAAIIEAWDDNANINEGGVLIDQQYTDDVHPKSDAQLQALADRWWLAISEQYYGASSKLAPRISSASRTGTNVTLTYNKTLASGTTYGAFTYADNAGAVTVNSATRTSGTTIVLALNSTPSGTGEVATFANADTAAGATVPKNAAGMPAIPQSISVSTAAAPTITSNGGGSTASINAAENQTTVTTVTATGSPTPTFSITGGADADKFSIVGATGVLTFVSPPDYESPTDSGSNNTYVVAVTATNSEGTDVQTITVTVTNVHEAGELILDLPMQEATGEWQDASASGNDTTFFQNSAATYFLSGQGPGGSYPHAVDLDAINDLGERAELTTPIPFGGEVQQTIQFFIAGMDNGNDTTAVLWSPDDGDGVSLIAIDDARLYMFVEDATHIEAFYSIGNDLAWHHYAIVFNNDMWSYYVDAVLRDSGGGELGARSLAWTQVLDGGHAPGAVPVGKFCGLRIYDGVRTQQQIAADAALGGIGGGGPASGALTGALYEPLNVQLANFNDGFDED